MRETISKQYVEDLSTDEIENQGLKYEKQGWTKVQYTTTKERGWKVYEWTGIRPEPSESIDFVNVTSQDPDKSELVEALEDAGIHGATVDYWTEPYRFEDAYQISTLYFRR